MIALLCFFLTLFALPFKSKSRLVAENAVLRHQLTVLHRKLREIDRGLRDLMRRMSRENPKWGASGSIVNERLVRDLFT